MLQAHAEYIQKLIAIGLSGSLSDNDIPRDTPSDTPSDTNETPPEEVDHDFGLEHHLGLVAPGVCDSQRVYVDTLDFRIVEPQSSSNSFFR